ncbi:ribonuclease P protein component [Enemella sp. A6]|uniref:ribonuclease P protein component n=1 Tax=Enemella sp. A6 TaxID=3440152 RepID=UPI003EBE3AB3
MLPAAVRMRSSDDFRATARGARSGRPCVVVHARSVPPTDQSPNQQTNQRPDANIRVGFVVSKSVGGAVVRNRVKRRLRHAVAEHLPSTPSDTHVVVRALPSAANATWATLREELAGAWHGAVRRAGREQR